MPKETTTLRRILERDRTIARLESENQLHLADVRQRTLLLWLTVAAMVVLAVQLDLITGLILFPYLAWLCVAAALCQVLRLLYYLLRWNRAGLAAGGIRLLIWVVATAGQANHQSNCTEIEVCSCYRFDATNKGEAGKEPKHIASFVGTNREDSCASNRKVAET